jgi:hypothetical protein
VPKSLDKLQEDVNDWSLADDAGLLLVLEEISNKLKSQMRDVEVSVDDLLHETHACHVGVRNTLTRFSMLSNKQFVENRYSAHPSSSSCSSSIDYPCHAIHLCERGGGGGGGGAPTSHQGQHPTHGPGLGH